MFFLPKTNQPTTTKLYAHHPICILQQPAVPLPLLPQSAACFIVTNSTSNSNANAAIRVVQLADVAFTASASSSSSSSASSNSQANPSSNGTIPSVGIAHQYVLAGFFGVFLAVCIACFWLAAFQCWCAKKRFCLCRRRRQTINGGGDDRNANRTQQQHNVMIATNTKRRVQGE